jgi:hypothetical protein
MKNLIVIVFFASIPCSLFAQWGTFGADIYNSNAGFVGIGTAAPAVKLHVQTPSSDSDETVLKIGHRSDSKEVGAIIEIGTPEYRTGGTARIVGYSNPHSVVYSKLALQTWNGTTWNNVLMDGLGNVGIGTTTPAANLDVNGTTYSRKLFVGAPDANTITNMGANNLLAVNGTAVFVKAKVALYGSAWPDYVFSPDYQMPTLDSLEKFIKSHSHLPEIPKAEEIKNNGIDLGENQALLLKKIEELTLFAIEQNKQSEKLMKIADEQAKQSENLQKVIEEQNQKINEQANRISELEKLK